MSGRIKVNSPPIAPIYSQSEPNQTIDLGEVAVEYVHKGTAHNDIAHARLRFAPDNRLEFVCPLEDKSPLFGMKFFIDGDPNVKLVLKERNVSFDAFCTGSGGDKGGIVFVPTKSGVMATPPSEAITAATIHLFNFPDFNGPEDYILVSGQPRMEGMRVCGYVGLKADGWSIAIAATDRTDSIMKKLETLGGYALTHVGEIRREDGSTFSSEQLNGLLGCIHHFLSFASGRWAGLALPVGFDAEKNKVFEEWGMRMTADGAWNGSYSWFDLRHGDLLSEVFPGFMALWSNQTWRKPLRHALYWYLGACDRGVGIGVDTGLILAQTALETLAWTYCVLDRKMVSAAAFKPRGLSAADKLRLLTSSLSIPHEIPSGLSALHGKPGKKWLDGLDAITGIRNSLVHAGEITDLPENSYFEACNLSLWYIDLVLLRMCGHGGNYANRLAQHRWAGQVEPVPWAKQVTQTNVTPSIVAEEVAPSPENDGAARDQTTKQT